MYKEIQVSTDGVEVSTVSKVRLFEEFQRTEKRKRTRKAVAGRHAENRHIRRRLRREGPIPTRARRDPDSGVLFLRTRGDARCNACAYVPFHSLPCTCLLVVRRPTAVDGVRRLLPVLLYPYV